MAAPRAKRPKILRGEDDYVPGNIIEIELHNFMTFSHLKCKPGPRLNLVIGPNGSGKSSIVCSIALGLGGEPQLLGRAASIGAYVKRGEDSGYINVTLRGETKEQKITIMRRIDTHNKSEWLYNGKVVPKKDVVEIVQSFNIQVGNLTQFLPQDRVCEFAKLTPVQLLEETEKAVGDPQLPVQHRALVEKCRGLKQNELAIENKEATLNQLKALNAEQEKDVERVRKREELLAKVETMKKKLPWLLYDKKKTEYLEAKKKKEDAKRKLEEAAKILDELSKPIEKHKQEKAALENKSKKITSHINASSKKQMDLLEKENTLVAQLQGKYKTVEDLKRQEESRQLRLLKAREELDAAKAELQNLPMYESSNEDLERLKDAISEIDCSAMELRGKKSDMDKELIKGKKLLHDCIDRLTKMDDKNTKCLHILQNSMAEKIFEAYHWVQEHRHEFKKDVYGPVLLEVNVTNHVHAGYLEGQIASYIWKSFITQDPSDRDLLVKSLKHFDVPVLNYTGGGNSRRMPFHISEDMRALGIYSRLDQVFDAPDAVKEVLIEQFALDRSYVGSKETDQRADEAQNLGVSDLWTPDSHYRWSKSRYGGHISAMVDSVERSRLLFYNNSDVGEIERLKLKKQEHEVFISTFERNIKRLYAEISHLENQASDLRKERTEIIDNIQREKGKRTEIKNRIEQRTRKLESIEKEPDLDTQMANVMNQAADCNVKRFNNAIEIKDLLVEIVAYRQSFAENHMACLEYDAKIREMELNLKQQEKHAVQASAHFKDCEEIAEDRRQKLSEAKRQAELIATITPELESAFLAMPTTVEELNAAIQDTISEANSILFLNHNILEEYEHRRRQIEALEAKLEADKKELQSCLAEIDNLKGKWLPTLRNLVEKINETFSRNFREMAVAGEVSLDEHDMDFGQFGILIKVKFRQAGQLQVLSAHHQSGGERSVSTILYLVSLQDLTHCPFRVVDEINQGMDPINERKMFQQLVRAASQPNTPQCFLLTPKLLPDLHYSEACSILNVMNGPWIDQPSKVWSTGDRWGSVTGSLAQSQC